MGYFSQRKRRERENLFIKVMIVLLGIPAVLALFDAAGSPWLEALDRGGFQYFVVALAVFVFALWRQRFLYAFWLLLIVLADYGHLASAAPIFRNADVAGDKRVSIVYRPGEAPSVRQAPTDLLRAGRINLTPDYQAHFSDVQIENKEISVVSLDLEQIPAEEKDLAFENLARFIQSKDIPVVLIGNLGEPAWSDRIKSFLNQTSLQVKNRILPITHHSKFNPFAVPQYNILGFKNVGVDSVKVLPQKDDRPFSLTAEILFY